MHFWNYKMKIKKKSICRSMLIPSKLVNGVMLFLKKHWKEVSLKCITLSFDVWKINSI